MVDSLSSGVRVAFSPKTCAMPNVYMIRRNQWCRTENEMLVSILETAILETAIVHDQVISSI